MTSAAELIHVWYHCHGCEARPIVGRCYTCQTCPAGPDNDLCEACWETFRRGELHHPSETSFAATLNLGEHVFESSEGQPREGFLHWFEPPHPAAADPAVHDGFVVRPEFRAGNESFLGSYAFVVEVDAQPVLLTALHILDELIRKQEIDATVDNADYTGRELPAAISEVRLYDVFAANWVLAELGGAGPMLVLPGARTDDEEPESHRDIAAFRMRDAGGFAPGRLAERPPEVGEPVWLAAKILHRPPPGEILHRPPPGEPLSPPGRRALKAVVVERTETAMIFRFEDAALEAPYSSGAPVVDRTGSVVGINVGGGWLDAERLGHANHVDNIRRHLCES